MRSQKFSIHLWIKELQEVFCIEPFFIEKTIKMMSLLPEEFWKPSVIKFIAIGCLRIILKWSFDDLDKNLLFDFDHCLPHKTNWLNVECQILDHFSWAINFILIPN